MKLSLYLLFGMIMTFCSCGPNHLPAKLIVYPDKKLEEIVIKGRHDPSNSENPFEWVEEVFCYNKVKNKTPIFDKNLKSRLYDKEGKILAEDFIRSNGTDVRVYLPYHNNGELRLVKLKDGKEITFYTTSLTAESKLKEYVDKYIEDPNVFGDYGLRYDVKSECFSNRGI